MNRRKAIQLGLISGGLLPATLRAQDDPAGFEDEPDTAAPEGSFRRAGSGRRATRLPDDGTMPAEEDIPSPAEAEPAPELTPSPDDPGLPADFPTERGQIYRSFDISRYTSLPHNDSQPQNALIEWIFRRTGSSIWHGEALAVLSASRAQLRVYHSRKVMEQVQEMVERFTDAQPSDYLKLRVRVVSAADTRWRYAVATRLNPIATGEQGQQVWTLSLEDAAMVRTQMQVYQGFKLLVDQVVTIINGQTLTVVKELDVEYISGPQRDSAVGLGYQPVSAKIKEGGVLRVSPLLTYEGDSLEVAIDLKANSVQKLHPTKILTRREVGPVDMTIDVPEVGQTRLNQSIKGWKLGETLVISAGIHPGILQSKNGFLNLRLPGTVPTKTEFLVFLDCETVGAPPPRTARARESVSG